MLPQVFYCVNCPSYQPPQHPRLLPPSLLLILELKHQKRNHKQEKMSADLTQFIPPPFQLVNIPILKCRDISQLTCNFFIPGFCSSQVLLLASQNKSVGITSE